MSISKLYHPEIEQALDDCQNIIKEINAKKLSFDNLGQTITVLATNIKDIADCILHEMQRESQ